MEQPPPAIIKMVAHRGFEPLISALRGRCPGPLDECATGPAGGNPAKHTPIITDPPRLATRPRPSARASLFSQQTVIPAPHRHSGESRNPEIAPVKRCSSAWQQQNPPISREYKRPCGPARAAKLSPNLFDDTCPLTPPVAPPYHHNRQVHPPEHRAQTPLGIVPPHPPNAWGRLSP